MEEDNIIVKHWREQEKIFIDNLVISRKRPTKDSVHDLRVAVKKLRSYLRLKKQMTGDEWKRSFSNMSCLFKSFGRLGDFDVTLILTRQQEKKENLSVLFFKEYLFINRSLVRKWVKQDAIKFNDQELNALTQQIKSDLTDKEICEKIIQLTFSKVKKVKVLNKHFQKNAHKIRKQLKDVYNWIKNCPNDLAENFIRIKPLDQMLKYLGSYQDHDVLRKKIKQYTKEVSENKEKAILKTLENKLASIQDDLLENAKNKWKAVIDQERYKKAASSRF